MDHRVDGSERARTPNLNPNPNGRTQELIGQKEREGIEADCFSKLEHKATILAKNEEMKPRVALLQVC